MKLNKKGTTLIELVVSIALLSIVMVFMFRLLADVNNDKYNNDFAEDNQVTRAEIIKTIEEDLQTKNIINVAKNGKNEIKFYYGPSANEYFSLSIPDEKTLIFKGSKTRKWTMKKCKLGGVPDALFGADADGNDLHLYKSSEDKYLAFTINIEVYNSNDNNSKVAVDADGKFTKKNNLIDDITITYFNRYISL